jgi:hypothetical protein
MSEWTYDPDIDDIEPDEDDVDELYLIGATEFFDDYDEPPKIVGEYSRPATRKPFRLDRRRDLDELPPLDSYQPTARG